jgi:hypothetical protein
MLDAYFNALVVEALHWEGETNVVAVHDSWFVPAVHLYVDRAGGCAGAELVERAIADAGREWLNGIGGVYGWLADATLGTPHRRFAREIRQRWRRRITEQRWPRFTAS